jgi:predicted NBD/HSP70 family sugar kinase
MHAQEHPHTMDESHDLTSCQRVRSIADHTTPLQVPFNTCRALILQIEASVVTMHRAVINKGEIHEHAHLDSWDPGRFISDRKGIRLLEEIARHCQSICSKDKIDCVALTLPGTVDGTSIIEGSSRLGIYEALDVTAECAKLRMPPTFVFHDAECLALGEVLSSLTPLHPEMESGKETFVYIIVGEGVGSSIFIDGKPYHGAGVAGQIGRLMMHPSGTFSPIFNSRGTLEVFAARPWVSQNVVNEYLAEKDKAGALPANSSSFRAAVAAAANTGKLQLLTFSQLDEGIKEKDALLLSVLEDAAQNLAIAINSIITILNPPLIVLGGGMITELSGFAQKVIDYTRRNAFAGSWNATTIHIARGAADSQIKGTAYFLSHTGTEDL